MATEVVSGVNTNSLGLFFDSKRVGNRSPQESRGYRTHSALGATALQESRDCRTHFALGSAALQESHGCRTHFALGLTVLAGPFCHRNQCTTVRVEFQIQERDFMRVGVYNFC